MTKKTCGECGHLMFTGGQSGMPPYTCYARPSTWHNREACAQFSQKSASTSGSSVSLAEFMKLFPIALLGIILSMCFIVGIVMIIPGTSYEATIGIVMVVSTVIISGIMICIAVALDRRKSKKHSPENAASSTAKMLKKLAKERATKEKEQKKLEKIIHKATSGLNKNIHKMTAEQGNHAVLEIQKNIAKKTGLDFESAKMAFEKYAPRHIFRSMKAKTEAKESCTTLRELSPEEAENLKEKVIMYTSELEVSFRKMTKAQRLCAITEVHKKIENETGLELAHVADAYKQHAPKSVHIKAVLK